MAEPTPAERTIRRLVRVVVGEVVTHYTPDDYAQLSREERAAVVSPHLDLIDRATDALVDIVESAHKRGIAEAYGHLRRADAFDPEAVDEVMAAAFGPDADAEPLPVPRRPWPGGL